MTQQLSRLYDDLKPYIAKQINAALQGGASAATSGGGGALAAHSLSGAYHTGPLANWQGPQFPLLGGGRTYTGDIVLLAGLTVDGVDVSEHAANPSAHHNPVTAGDGIDLSGQQVAVDVTDILGTGLSESANNLQVNQGYAFAWTANHTHAGNVTFTGAARTITSDGGYNLTIGAAGDLVLDPTGNIMLPNSQELRTVDFSDLVTGIAGLRLWDRGSNYRQLTMGAIKIDELYARVFVADEVRIDRGEEYWSKSFGIVETDFDLPAVGSTVDVWFENAPALATANLFSNNDWLLFRTIDWGTGIVISKFWMQVISKTAEPTTATRQQWRLARRSGGTTGQTVKAGGLGLDVGQSGQGWVHLSALEQDGGPFIQIGDWSGGDPYTASNFTNRVRMGNLNGVGGIATDTWGFAAATSLATVIGSGFEGIVIDPINGVRLYNADVKLYDGSTQTVWLDPDNGLTLRSNGLSLAGPYNLVGIALLDEKRTVSFSDGTNRYATLGGTKDTAPAPDEYGVSLDVISPGVSQRAVLRLSVASTGATVTDTNPMLFLEHSGPTNQATLAANKLFFSTNIYPADTDNGLTFYGANGGILFRGKTNTTALAISHLVEHAIGVFDVWSLDADSTNFFDAYGQGPALSILTGGYAAAKQFRAYDANGLSLQDDGGNVGLTVEDGGHVAIGDTGSWTPTIYGSTTPGSPTFTSGGTYVRIGKICYVSGYVAVSNVGTMAGNIYIGGLPFNAARADSQPLMLWAGLATAHVQMSVATVPNNTYFKILGITGASSSSNTWSNVSILDNSCEIDFSFWYITT